MYRLDAELNRDTIDELKKPLGKLFSNFEDAIPEITSSPFLISVGDATFNNLINNNILPNVGIIDNLIKRKNHVWDHLPMENILNVKNSAGTITDDLCKCIKEAILLAEDGEDQLIIVDGEEDLAVLPCILIAPEDTIILYGQPNEGLVLLNASDFKEKAYNLINNFIKE